jgi:hypothetical protein
VTLAPTDFSDLATKPFPQVAVVFVYPVFGKHHDDFARLFAEDYQKYPAGYEHTLYVVSNGGPPTVRMKEVLTGIPCQFLEHDDSGWDIGAYQKAVEVISCDLVVLLGGTVYFEKPNWLHRMVEAYLKHGPHLYGAFACRQPKIHIRTTGFWMPPELLRRYPHRITTVEERYHFEWNKYNFTQWVVDSGRKAILATWSTEIESKDWEPVAGYYGSRIDGDCLIGDKRCNTSGVIR